MLKFLGSLFIVSSMTGIGIWKAEEVKHSYQALGKIYHLIGMMKNELSYAGSEFGEMFECLSKKVDAPYRNWLLDINDKSQIIFHSHVNSIFQGDDFQHFRIFIMSPTDCVIKGQ